ncbi:MAG: hypothetical protein ACTHNW_04380 [Mucilaginibacter sp.]
MATYIVHPTVEQEKTLRAFLKASDIAFIKVKEDEKLLEYVLAGITKGQEDIKAGRTLSFDCFKKRMTSTKKN